MIRLWWASAFSCATLLAVSAGPRATTVTLLANRARKTASSTALLPPPITSTS